jgi:hypothetical protein
MSTILALLSRLFDVLLRPFQSLDPLYGLLVVSVLTGLLMVLVFRYTSNQRAIKAAKDRLKAHLLALWLFQDQLSVVFQTHRRLLATTAAYMKQSLLPLAVLFLPLVIILVQLELRLGQQPLQPGESFLLKAHLTDSTQLMETSLRLPPGLALAAPPLRIVEQKEIDWKITAKQSGTFQVDVVVGQRDFAKQVIAADSLVRLSPRRVRAGVLGAFLNPGEPLLPSDGPVESIEVRYRPRQVAVGPWQMHWLIPFLVFSLVSAFSVKGVLRTEF